MQDLSLITTWIHDFLSSLMPGWLTVTVAMMV